MRVCAPATLQGATSPEDANLRTQRRTGAISPRTAGPPSRTDRPGRRTGAAPPQTAGEANRTFGPAPYQSDSRGP